MFRKFNLIEYATRVSEGTEQFPPTRAIYRIQNNLLSEGEFRLYYIHNLVPDCMSKVLYGKFSIPLHKG